MTSLSLVFVLIALPLAFANPQRTQEVNGIYQIAWSPVANQLTFVDYSNNIHVWNVTNSRHWVMLGNTNYIDSIHWSPDGTLLAANSFSGKNVTIWEVASGEVLITIVEETGSLGLDWTPDGKYLLTSTDGVDDAPELRQWDITTGALVQKYAIGAVGIHRSPDNRTLALIQAALVELRDATTLEFKTKLSQAGDYEQGYQPVAVRWSNDGRLLAAGYLNGIVRLWDIDTLEVIQEFQATKQVFENRGVPSTTIKEIAFSLDGQFLWSLSADGTLRQWEVNTARLIIDQQMNEAVLAAAWSPYQARLVVGTMSGEPAITVAPPVVEDLRSFPGLQISVPTASIEQIRTIAQKCMSSQQQRELRISTLASKDLSDLAAELQSLPVSIRSTACFADVLAVVEVLYQK